MSLSIVLELATCVAYIVIIAGGKQRRDQGWKILIGLLAIGSAAQCACMAMVVSIHSISGYPLPISGQISSHLTEHHTVLSTDTEHNFTGLPFQ
jgi:hypothetical protein